MNYSKSEQNINIDSYIYNPNIASNNNSDNIPFLPNNITNLLESEDIEEKCHINNYDNSSFDDLRCILRKFHEKINSLGSSPKDYIIDFQKNSYDTDNEINIDECYYTSKTSKSKKNINYRILFNVRRKKEKKKI